MDRKIAIIGGGSVQWTPTLLRDIILSPSLAGSRLVLEDIDSEALELTLTFGRRLIELADAAFSVETTTDLDAALDAADFVILTISTGGLEAMRHDLEIPKRYGVVQTVGDTIGPGGIFRALRTIPVVVDIARRMERRCPEALLLNYSNPMTCLTRAVAKTTRVRVAGLCHELFGTLGLLKEIFGTDDETDLDIVPTGVNHLVWIIALKFRGQDAMHRLREFIEEHPEMHREHNFEIPSHVVLSETSAVKFALFKAFGALPAAGDRHLVEFFPFFLMDGTSHGRRWGVRPTTVEHRYEWLHVARCRIREMIGGKRPVPMRRSGEKAADIMSAFASAEPQSHIVNVPNAGQVTNLPGEAVLEGFATVGANGIVPEPVGEIPCGIRGVLEKIIAEQEIVVEAALTGQRDLVRQAFALDPLTRDLGDAERLAANLFEAHRQYLPQFARVGERS